LRAMGPCVAEQGGYVDTTIADSGARRQEPRARSSNKALSDEERVLLETYAD